MGIVEDLLREEYINISAAPKQPLMSRNIFPRSIDRIPNVLPKASLFPYPAMTDIHISALKDWTTQLKQVRILEKLIGKKEVSGRKLMNRAHPNLVLEVGGEFTRAILFDVIEDSYRLVAVGESHTSFELPGNDIELGIRQACDQLLDVTGYKFLHSDDDDLFRGYSNGKKSHVTAITLLCNHQLNVVVINARPKSSTFELRKFLTGIPGQIIGEISIEDDGSIFAALDAVVHLKPDVVYIAGLEDNENKNLHERIKKLSHIIRLSIPAAQQPVLIDAAMNSITRVNQCSIKSGVLNPKETYFMESSEVEQTDLLKDRLGDISAGNQKVNLSGLFSVTHSITNDIISGSEAFGRIIQFLDLSTGLNKGVLGIEIGPKKTLIAAAQSGELRMEEFPEYGLSSGISNILNNIPIAEITEWLPFDVGEPYVNEYVFNKSLYPSSIPVSVKDLDIEFAIAQQILKFSISVINKNIQGKSKIKSTEVRPSFDRILVSGGILSQGQDLIKTTLALLNGIQPVGATTLFLDTNQFVSALGAAAVDNPLLAVQVLESGIITHLCTLLSAESEADTGSLILKIRMVGQNGDEEDFEIKKGDLLKLPLSRGETANLFLQPYHRCDVGMGAPGRGGVVRVTGGHIGVIIDARGRPLALKREKYHRIAQIKGWYWALDGDFT